eukprot:15329983-Ditylum_brightwellii.AAC.1
MQLHSKCRDINSDWLCCLVPWKALTTTPTLVSKEPPGLSSRYPGVHSLDLAVTTLEGMKGSNFTIIGTPPHLSNSHGSGHYDHPLSH